VPPLPPTSANGTLVRRALGASVSPPTLISRNTSGPNASLPAPANDVDPEPDEFGNVRGPANLYMNGAEVMAFALKTVPEAAARLMAKSDRSIGDYDLVVLHQASALLLDKLQRKLGVGDNRFVRRMESCGNTVSSTIPLALEPYLQDAGSSPRRALLVGFGVGYAWAAAEVVI